jgi:hypothetical protein
MKTETLLLLAGAGVAVWYFFFSTPATTAIATTPSTSVAVTSGGTPVTPAAPVLTPLQAGPVDSPAYEAAKAQLALSGLQGMMRR